jgi:sorting nexin-25
MQHLNVQFAIIVSVVAVVFPTILKVASSPLTLLLVSPFILLSILICFLATNVILGNVLDKIRLRPSNPLPSVARPFAFSTPAAWQAVITRSQWSHRAPQSLSPLYPDSPVISAALNDILIMIVRDFVLTWYKELSSSPSFPTAVSSTLHCSLERILSRLAKVDIPVLVVNRILPKITTHIEQFRQSEIALRGARLERHLTQSEELDILLASKYASMGAGRLHPAVDNLSSTFTRQTEEAHLRKLIYKALPLVLPEKEAQSPVVKVVVREIAACAVFYPAVEMLSDPDFWNRAIDSVVCNVSFQNHFITNTT